MVTRDRTLTELLRDEIDAAPDQRITFARFMERALTEPGLGYYARDRDRPTRRGDFLSAPELHPFFGRCLGRHLEDLWRRIGSPVRFEVIEWGAGRGMLESTVLAGLRLDGSSVAEVIEWQGIDLPADHRPQARAPITGAVLANEFLDALPVHRVAQRDGVLLERFVGWDGGFREVDGEPSTPALAARLKREGVSLADGQVAEIGLEASAWVGSAAADLELGALIVMDYGHPAPELYGARRMAGTLMTYQGHRAGSDPFEAVGLQDITAHVDLTAIEDAALEAGLQRLGHASQARFLVRLGLGELLSDVGRDPATDPDAYMAARSSVARLLDPRHLGGFHVLSYGRGVAADPPLRGFGEP
jgi:SAM-dependent MidA family methyltransferase